MKKLPLREFFGKQWYVYYFNLSFTIAITAPTAALMMIVMATSITIF
jgi:hypothetical protein